MAGETIQPLMETARPQPVRAAMSHNAVTPHVFLYLTLYLALFLTADINNI